MKQLGYYDHKYQIPFITNDNSIPVVIDKNIFALEPAYLWIDDGASPLKIGMSVENFVDYFGTRVHILEISNSKQN